VPDEQSGGPCDPEDPEAGHAHTREEQDHRDALALRMRHGARVHAGGAGVTRCSCCGTTEGPFVRSRDLPGKPVCGVPRRWYGRLLPSERVLGCLQRRRLLDDERAARTPAGPQAVPA
jgi:hypothetical protein